MGVIKKTDVVVGIDGSETSTAAAVWAAGEAGRRGARLVLLYSYVLYAYGSKDAALPGSVPYEEAGSLPTSCCRMPPTPSETPTRMLKSRCCSSTRRRRPRCWR